MNKFNLQQFAVAVSGKKDRIPIPSSLRRRAKRGAYWRL